MLLINSSKIFPLNRILDSSEIIWTFPEDPLIVRLRIIIFNHWVNLRPHRAKSILQVCRVKQFYPTQWLYANCLCVQSFTFYIGFGILRIGFIKSCVIFRFPYSGQLLVDKYPYIFVSFGSFTFSNSVN